jgi:hypothetical protein
MIKTLIIDVHDDKWDAVISKCKAYDFYHTRSYHKLETDRNGDEAVLFVCFLEQVFIAIPLVIREIEGTQYFDCTSVYGYSGPLSNEEASDISEALIEIFRIELLEYFRKENIVTVFSRLHPLIETQVVFNNFGTIRNVNKTVAININLTPEEQRKQYRKSNKSEINQLRKKKGYTVKKAETDEEITAFVAIYFKTMERVSADNYYFFEANYFRKILDDPNYEAILLLALKEDTITAGAIFTITNKLMQYHLAGTATPFINDTPMKLILDEARLLANSLQLNFLHLGGGVGGNDDDSLFRFKAGFSKMYFQFSTWQYIVYPETYNELVSKNGVLESEYFPLYRAPKKE